MSDEKNLIFSSTHVVSNADLMGMRRSPKINFARTDELFVDGVKFRLRVNEEGYILLMKLLEGIAREIEAARAEASDETHG